jgi:hypothetical protein
MEAIGLIPSSTGEPGGKKTGQTMADYPQEGGKFMAEAEDILKGRELIAYYKREVFQRKAFEMATSEGTEGAWEQAAEAFTSNGETGTSEMVKPRPPSKLKYSCPKCQANAWGKPGLEIICGACWNPTAPVYFKNS